MLINLYDLLYVIRGYIRWTWKGDERDGIGS